MHGYYVYMVMCIKKEIVGINCIHCSHQLEVFLCNIMYPHLWVVFNVCRCELRPLCVVCIYRHVCVQQNSVASLTLGGHALSVATATYGSLLVHVPKHMNMEPAGLGKPNDLLVPTIC